MTDELPAGDQVVSQGRATLDEGEVLAPLAAPLGDLRRVAEELGEVTTKLAHSEKRNEELTERLDKLDQGQTEILRQIGESDGE